MNHGQQAYHQLPCVTCHAGNNQENTKEQAHLGMTAFPGNLSNADKACGQCHQDQVASVHAHVMTTARGMVETTRRVLGDPDDGADISGLGNSRSDSLLRKLCAGCHLGRERETHAHSTRNRGGGCLACHLDEYPEKGHVRLTRNISDARCFGCHSRSGRISLNYVGLTETDSTEAGKTDKKGRLPDGRLVQIRESDVHHQAGMSCIDCHTGNGLMGTGASHKKPVNGIDIQCMDCHRTFEDIDDSIKTQHNQTLLGHIEKSSSGLGLRSRNSNRLLPIPAYNKNTHAFEKEHARLSCDACHTQWAPLCFGCHIKYDPKGTQYDYLEKAPTPGRWKEDRWQTHAGLPPLGIDASNTIRPFVPGMILTLEHPDLDRPLFRRLYAPLSPHTIGKARSCQSCHCSSSALGLGAGTLSKTEDGWNFTAEQPLLQDGVPQDAWQSWTHPGVGESSQIGSRPLNLDEIQRVLNSGVECQ